MRFFQVWVWLEGAKNFFQGKEKLSYTLRRGEKFVLYTLIEIIVID